MSMETFKNPEESAEKLSIGEVVRDIAFEKNSNGDYVGYDEKENVFILPSGPGTDAGEYKFNADAEVIYIADDEAGEKRYIVKNISE